MEWRGGGQVIKAELCSRGSRCSALLRCERSKNPHAAAFAAEEAEVFKKYAVLYAAGHTLNEQALVWVRDQDGHQEIRG